MTHFLLAAVLAAPVLAQDVNLPRLLSALESRYNGTKTLQVSFEESFTGAGRPRQSESGELYLRKPGRMRWEYKKPLGKLFISDGKDIFYYNPVSKRAEKVKLKESEDLRAPLAFLLGKLDFRKDFGNIQYRQEGSDVLITAAPKSDRLPYRQVEFIVSPQREIRKLIVTGQDNSLLTFNFWDERMNPKLAETTFRFELPAGATWIDSTEGASQ